MATTFIAHAAQAVTTAAGDQAGASVAMLANGGHVVAWNSGGNVIAQFFDASGAKSGGEVTLFTGHTLGGIEALADGSIVASASKVTQGPDGYPLSSLWFERLDAGGNVIAPPALVDGTGTYDVAVTGGDVYAMPGGGFGITDIHTTRPVPWSSVDESIKVYGANNAPTGAAIPGETNYMQETAQLRSGGFLVEGSASYGPMPVDSAMWRTVDTQGNTIASAMFTGQYGVNGYGDGGAVTLADGRALAVWSFMEYGTTGVAHITWQAQWIDASGHPTGGVFTLGLDTSWNPTFTALAGGGFIATWTQQTNYGTPYDLYVQHFDASAQPDSTPRLLTSLDAGHSGNSAYEVSATSDGGFLVDFARAGNGLDVWEQEFDVTTANEMKAWRLYQAAFDRLPDEAGLQYQTHDLDMGYSLSHVAQNFIDSPEFQRTYGPSTSDTEFITLLYRNVLNREPESAGLQYHLDEFAHGDSRADMLTHFSESPENQVLVMGQIESGAFFSG